MNSERHERVKKLFLEICALAQEERATALDLACGDDAELRGEIESLLEFHEGPQGHAMLDEPEADLTRASAGEPQIARSEIFPRNIGGYRVIRKLGEGGMGVVYEVRQDKPIRRRLALKLVKWGMDTEEVLTRFESERQVLALLNHPNIAKVFEAGATENGRPYFTMEYVDGEPITGYCDKHCLTTPERLGLFMQVCDGVQHAHQNGIIHRDIKSSNLLVRIQNDRPVPAIIDFGVAKATQQRLTERTLYTEQGMLIGTPEYMSPEQAELSGLEVDTRTDVYSLGVVLYELLVGTLPFESKTLREAGFDEIRRRIREVEPARPSTRINTLGDATGETARRRRTNPENLRRELSGDMDWITMKALEKDRTRRYASPAEMNADIARHLRHEAVLAGPPSKIYHIRKFVRRHRLGVAAGISVALALIFGLALATTGLVRARKAERIAREEADTARKISNLLVDMYDDLNPAVPGRATSPDQILERERQKIEEVFAEEPALQARLLGTLAGAYSAHGMPERARELTEKSVSLCRKHLPPEHFFRQAAIGVLGDSLAASGDLDGAQALHEETLSVWLRVLRPGQENLALARNYQSLGRILFQKSEFAGSRTYLDKSQAILENQTGPYRVHLARTLLWQARLDSDVDLNHEVALPRLQRALKIMEEEYGPNHNEIPHFRFWLGRVCFRLGDVDAAQVHYERALKDQESTFGLDSPAVAMSLTGLGEVLARAGDLETAREHLERAHKILVTSGGVENPDTEWTVRCLASVHRRAGDSDKARSLLESNIENLENGLGTNHPALTRTLHQLGDLAAHAGDYDRARPLYRRALAIEQKVWGTGHHISTRTYYQLACIASLEKEAELALDLLRNAVDSGYDGETILEDSDLNSLRDHPEFEEMVAKVRRRLESKRNK